MRFTKVIFAWRSSHSQGGTLRTTAPHLSRNWQLVPLSDNIADAYGDANLGKGTSHNLVQARLPIVCCIPKRRRRPIFGLYELLMRNFPKPRFSLGFVLGTPVLLVRNDSELVFTATCTGISEKSGYSVSDFDSERNVLPPFFSSSIGLWGTRTWDTKSRHATGI